MYIMCNIVHIYSLDYPQSINTLIYSGEKIQPKITVLGFFSMENVSILNADVSLLESFFEL